MKPADYWKQVREVCDKAPPGPWSQILDGNDRWLIEADNNEEVARRLNENNAAFIAMSRTALPEALDEIDSLRAGQQNDDRDHRRLTEEIERLRTALAATLEDLEETVAYAPEYFRWKWDLGASLPAARAALGKP